MLAWFCASDRITQPGSRAPERAEGGPVGDVAGGEEQRRRLAVQVGELALQQHVVVGGAGDVAGAAGAGAAASIASCIAASTAGCWPIPR